MSSCTGPITAARCSMDFQNFERTITKDGKDRVTKLPVAWSWIKISKRELIWDELPLLTGRAAERASSASRCP